MNIRARIRAKAQTFRYRGQETLAITRPRIRTSGGMREWMRYRKFQIKQKLGWIRQ